MKNYRESRLGHKSFSLICFISFGSRYDIPRARLDKDFHACWIYGHLGTLWLPCRFWLKPWARPFPNMYLRKLLVWRPLIISAILCPSSNLLTVFDSSINQFRNDSSLSYLIDQRYISVFFWTLDRRIKLGTTLLEDLWKSRQSMVSNSLTTRNRDRWAWDRLLGTWPLWFVCSLQSWFCALGCGRCNQASHHKEGRMAT